MKIPHSSLPRVWSAALAIFIALSATYFGVLWVNSGGSIPLFSRSAYRVTFPVQDANNLVYFCDVWIAGVPVGKVVEINNTADGTTVTVDLEKDVAPLHQGVTFRIAEKTLFEQSYVQVKDGTGPTIPSGTTVGPAAVLPSVTLDQVLDSLDPSTRTKLGSSIRSLGQATEGTAPSVSALLNGLGALGRSGGTALDALSKQSKQLESLSADTAVLLDALHAQNGQIAGLVDSGAQVAAAAGDGRDDLQATMRLLPGLLHSTSTASDKLDVLAGALGPVAADLRDAAPKLTSSLQELPGLSNDLRASMGPLDGTLRRSPDTLSRVSAFSDDTRDLARPARSVLLEFDPMLAYLRPYGHDIAALFSNFGAIGGAYGVGGDGAGNGAAARISPQFNEQIYLGTPVNTNLGPFARFNPYPAPLSSDNPRPLTGTYPRVKRDGNR